MSRLSYAVCWPIVDCSPSPTASTEYRLPPHRWPSAIIAALLLLLGGVEINPGPSPSPPPSSSMALLNTRSARHKAPLIHDVIAANRLDLLLLTETWIPSDAPDALKLDVAPTVTLLHTGPASNVAVVSPSYIVSASELCPKCVVNFVACSNSEERHNVV